MLYKTLAFKNSVALQLQGFPRHITTEFCLPLLTSINVIDFSLDEKVMVIEADSLTNDVTTVVFDEPTNV